MSKNFVRYGIGSASYNDSGSMSDVEAKMKAQRNDELRNGHKHWNLNLFRSRDAPDHVKFNLQLGGVPVFARAHYAMCQSGLEQIVMVGSRPAGQMHDDLCSYFSIPHSRFVFEGPSSTWSRSNTVNKAYQELGPSAKDLVIEIALDTPNIDVEAIRSDPDAPESDFLIRMNARSVCHDYFPRNYHLTIGVDGTPYDVKEGNGWGFNLRKIAQSHPIGLGCFEELYGARKAYGKSKSKILAAADVVIRNGEHDFSLGGYPVNSRWIGALKILGPDGIQELASLVGRKAIPALRKPGRKFVLPAEKVEALANYASRDHNFNTRVKISDDPGAILDLDSVQDIIFYAAMLAEDPSVYPYHDEMSSFAKDKQGKWGNDFTDNSHIYLNELCRRWDIDARFGNNGALAYQRVFDHKAIEAEIALLKKYQANKEPVHEYRARA